MIREFSRVTIVRLRKPGQKDINQDLQWFSKSLGLFGERDKEKSCFRIFIELLKATRKNNPITSDQIAFKTNITRATVIHHLNKLIESGIVIPAEKGYMLRSENLEGIIEEIKKDAMRVFEDLRLIAEELDEELGLLRREKQKTVV